MQARILNWLLVILEVLAYKVLLVSWYKAFFIKNCIYNTALSRASVSNDTNNS